MNGNHRVSWLFSVVTFAFVPAVGGEEFSARIVDGLGRPVVGVDVCVTWTLNGGAANGREVMLLRVRSDQNGNLRGPYDEKLMTGEGFQSVNFHKEGYEEIGVSGPFQRDYRLGRVFHRADIIRIAKLDDKARLPELRELLAGSLRDGDLETEIFVWERAFRTTLRELAGDPHLGVGVLCLLASIGEPADLAWVVPRLPHANKDDVLQDRWACEVVGGLLEPTTDAEWAFLKRCASGEFEFEAARPDAITILRLIASAKSRVILEGLHVDDDDYESMISQAIDYIKTNPAPFVDRELVRLGRRLASELKCGKWQGNTEPLYNEQRDKARIGLSFAEGIEAIKFTAVFHKVGEAWKLRGFRLWSLGTLAVPVDDADVPKK
jgi:hypothetical protein